MKEVICEQIGDYFNIKIHDEFPQLNKYIKFQKHIIYECNDNNKNQIQDNNNYKYLIGDATIQFDYTLSTPMDKQMLNTFNNVSLLFLLSKEIIVLFSNLHKRTYKKMMYEHHFLLFNNKFPCYNFKINNCRYLSSCFFLIYWI